MNRKKLNNPVSLARFEMDDEKKERFHLKLLVSKYLNYEEAYFSDDTEMKSVILAFFLSYGYDKAQITDFFLKEFLNGKKDRSIERRKRHVALRSKKEELLYQYEKYLKRKKGIGNFRKCFDSYYDPFIDIYPISNEEALQIVKRLKERRR